MVSASSRFSGTKIWISTNLRDASFWRDFHGLAVKQCSRIADLLQEVIHQQLSAFTGKGLELNAEATCEGLSGLNTDKPRRRQRLQSCHPSRRMNRPRR